MRNPAIYALTIARVPPFGSTTLPLGTQKLHHRQFILYAIFVTVPHFVHDLAHQEEPQALLPPRLQVLLHVRRGDPLRIEDPRGIADHDLEPVLVPLRLDLDRPLLAR